MKRRLILTTVLFSLPAVLAGAYGNWGLWLLAGYPLGVTPNYADLSLPVALAWRGLGIIIGLMYIMIGSFYSIRLRRVEDKKLSATMLGAFFTGLLANAIVRLIRLVEIFLNGSLNSQFQSGVANGVPQEVMISSIIVGLVIGIGYRIVGSGILSSLGALLVHIWPRKETT